MVRPILLQVRDIYYPILGAIGVPANLVTIIILSRGNCGPSKCISVYMLAITTADLLVMVINVLTYNVLSYHFPHIFLFYTVVCKLIMYLQCTSLHLSVWFTVSLTFDRFVAICSQKFKTRYCTVRTAAMVITTIGVLTALGNINNLFRYEPVRTVNNVQLGFRPSQDFYSSPAARTFSWLESILAAWIPFTLIFLFNCMRVSRILASSRACRGLQGYSSKNQSDPEMKNRRKSIILLFTVSGTFMLLWLTCIVTFLIVGLGIYAQPDYTAPAYIASETGYMLVYLSSFTNTFIYAATQTKFREELKKIMKSPWTIILILVKKMTNGTNSSCPN
ncbi:probable G-protein coupled receptor 139 [Heterodontus francisci]|uniref:probable G-protein coupled receptor 139 n=1 Tax=Heterodontus francisci TaxID=7792 RepID=UPI00355BCAB6